jgi:hypothetical protein
MCRQKPKKSQKLKKIKNNFTNLTRKMNHLRIKIHMDLLILDKLLSIKSQKLKLKQTRREIHLNNQSLNTNQSKKKEELPTKKKKR